MLGGSGEGGLQELDQKKLEALAVPFFHKGTTVVQEICNEFPQNNRRKLSMYPLTTYISCVAIIHTLMYCCDCVSGRTVSRTSPALPLYLSPPV